MSKSAAGISAETTVREAVRAYPGIDAVFDKYGLDGCGGDSGPLEPIGFFARMHGVETDTLLRELNEFASGARVAPAPADRPKAPAGGDHSYVLFLGTSVALALVVGLPVGILAAFAMSQGSSLRGLWMPLVQAHGQVQMMGWVGLFIMGMAYHIVPRFKATPLRYPGLVLPSFALVTAGLIVRLVAQPAADHAWAMPLVVLSGVLGAAGVLAFAASIVPTILGRGARQLFDAFLLAGVAYMAAAALGNLALLSELPSLGINVVPLPKQEPLLLLQLYGFSTMFILGVSMRVLPGFMGLRPPRQEALLAAFVLVNVGVVAQATAGWGAAYGGWDLERLDNWGSLSMVAGLAAFVAGLNVLLPSRESTPGPQMYKLLARGAYVWLLAAAGIEAFYAFKATSGGFGAGWLESGGIRHTLAVGFVTQIIFAVGTRALPVFAGRRLYSDALTAAVLVLVNLAVLLRVYPAFHEMGSQSWRYGAMGIGGVASVLAIALFAYNILRTVSASDVVGVKEAHAPAGQAGQPQPDGGTPPAIGPDTVVGEALKRPGALDVFLRYGFTPLADPAHRAVMADKVTVGGAALVHGIDLEAFLADLNGLQAASTAGGPVAPGSSARPGVDRALIDAALASCQDPELGVGIVDLGLVYGVEIEGGLVRIAMTLTTPDCPIGELLVDQVKAAVGVLPGVESVEVRLVREPAWSSERMTKRAREALGM